MVEFVPIKNMFISQKKVTIVNKHSGAMTLSITTLSITKFSILGLFTTLSITTFSVLGLFTILSLIKFRITTHSKMALLQYDTQHNRINSMECLYAECRYTEYRVFIVMVSFIGLSAFIVNVILTSIVAPTFQFVPMTGIAIVKVMEPFLKGMIFKYNTKWYYLFQLKY